MTDKQGESRRGHPTEVTDKQDESQRGHPTNRTRSSSDFRLEALLVALLKTFEYVVEDEDRTKRTRKLMPWFVAFFSMGLLALALLIQHVHAEQVEKPTAVGWSLVFVSASTAATTVVMKIRAKNRRKRKPTKKSARSEPTKKPEQPEPTSVSKKRSVCPHQARQRPLSRRSHAVGTPPGGTSRRDRHQAPHEEKPASGNE